MQSAELQMVLSLDFSRFQTVCKNGQLKLQSTNMSESHFLNFHHDRLIQNMLCSILGVGEFDFGDNDTPGGGYEGHRSMVIKLKIMCLLQLLQSI